MNQHPTDIDYADSLRGQTSSEDEGGSFAKGCLWACGIMVGAVVIACLTAKWWL
ncbi:MAG: hypothetical protein J0I45_16460 [Bosea sp.]|nr:hypothetical protein [Bosea sp. (in: a-proteobacteria)]